MSRRPVPQLLVAALLAGALLAGCGGSDGGSESSAGSAEATTTTAADDACPDETTYEITGPDGSTELTAAAAYAYESSDYLSLYLFSEDFAADEVASISTGFRTDDPGTIFASLHTRAAAGDESKIVTGTYVADSAEAQQALEPGQWVTDVAVSLGLDQVATGFPADPATEVTIDVIDDEKVCGTISHPSGTATFRADHLVSEG